MGSELKARAATVIIIFLVKYSSANDECRPGWELFEENCYVFIKQEVSNMDAKVFCDQEGAYLVEIMSDAENAFVASLVAENKGNSAWMGVNDLVQEGRWVYHSSGNPVTYTNWGAGQPSNSNGLEGCGEVNLDGKWNDIRCHAHLTFVCERSNKVPAQDQNYPLR